MTQEIFYMGMQLRPREKTRETLRFSGNNGPVIKRLLFTLGTRGFSRVRREFSVSAEATSGEAGAGHYKDLTGTGNRARKVSGTQGIYCYTTCKFFVEGDGAFLVWKNGPLISWSILEGSRKSNVQKPRDYEGDREAIPHIHPIP